MVFLLTWNGVDRVCVCVCDVFAETELYFHTTSLTEIVQNDFCLVY